MHNVAAIRLKSSFLISSNLLNLKFSLLDAIKNCGKNLVKSQWLSHYQVEIFLPHAISRDFFPNCNLLRVKARRERENGSNPFSTEVCLRLHRVILMMAFLTMGAVISIEEIFKCSHMKTTAAVED